MNRKVYIETYGCQMNVADSELLLGHLERHGFRGTREISDADVILVNTCAIRENAEERVVGRMTQLLEHKRRSPEVRLGMVGCVAQHHRERLLDRLPFLDVILGPDEYRKIPELLGSGAVSDPMVEVRLGREETYADIVPARGAGVRAWVSVMRGCDKFCTFCIVPYVRGRERSLPMPLVLDQVREAVNAGFREIVFLGQTVNAWRDGDHDFADLLTRAGGIEGVERIRFTSPHPSDMTDRVIDAMKDVPAVCPQVHLPLQSASDRVLGRMNRGYGIEAYDDLVARIREAVPDVEISTDVIVGFPGETESEYLETRAYFEKAGYDQAFLFAYSARPGTRAAQWADDVDEAEKKRRLADLIALHESILAERSRRWIGREVEVLVEGPARKQRDWCSGKTPHFRTVVFPSSAGAGETVTVRIEDATPHTLVGAPLGRDEDEEDRMIAHAS